MPTFCCGSPWRTSVELVHLPGSRLARQTLLALRPCEKAGAQVGTVIADDVALLHLQVGAELDRLAEVGAEHVDRALAAQVVARRVGAGDAAQDRQARLRRRAEEAVEEVALAVGRLGQGQRPGLDRARPRDPEGQLGLAVADLEAGDAADRLAGQRRAGRVGRRSRLRRARRSSSRPSRRRRSSRAARPTRTRQAAARIATATLRRHFALMPGSAPCEDIDMPVAPLVHWSSSRTAG